MDTENTNDEQNESLSKETFPTKSLGEERTGSQTTPTNTDINDPENLDYEDIDDNHQIKNPVKKKSSTDIDEEGEVTNNLPIASDEGELDEADLEDGEIHDANASKNKKNTSSDENLNRTDTGVPSTSQSKVHCRFYLQGRCHWGSNCKYIHPNNDSTKNGTSTDALASSNNDISPPTSAGLPQATTTSWISPQATSATTQFFPNPILRGQIPLTGTESAWERGLRSAKTLREQSMRRKQQDKDFNDKKFNLTIRDTIDDKETDDNLLNIDRPSSIDYDLDDYPEQRPYSERFHSYMYPNSQYNNHHRTNNNNNNNNNSRHNENMSINERRPRHSDNYNDNRNRKDKASTKDNKPTSKRDDSSSYRRNSSQQQYSSGSHHTNDEQLHPNPYNNRRGDDWHDPWDRSRNYGNSNRRSSGAGRGPSYSSSSGTSSSSSRSRSRSSSSSSRSRSRSRSRPKRRSPSVTRATKPLPTTKSSSETTKNGNEKKSNGNKKLVSPSRTTTPNKFLPGRQISSHTLKKAEKSSNHNHSSSNNHSKDQRGKDSDINSKKQSKKGSKSDSSSSSSSSSDSDVKKKTHRSSSSSSDSSNSENDSRTLTKTKTGKTSAGNNQSTKSVNRQLSASSSGGGGGKNSKSKIDSGNRESSTSAKKRRDTSSSTGSTSATKKPKLNDSHKSSTDASNAENSDSSKKKEKQKILKKLQEVEKIITQRSTKTSS